jgi:hypothetical protein
MPQLEEWSANFDAENVEPFLRRVSSLIESGFGDAEIKKATAFINSTGHDDEREMAFRVKYRGNDTDFRVRIFMDDIDSPDLYFFAPSALCDEIGQEMEKFAEELGI